MYKVLCSGLLQDVTLALRADSSVHSSAASIAAQIVQKQCREHVRNVKVLIYPSNFPQSTDRLRIRGTFWADNLDACGFQW